MAPDTESAGPFHTKFAAKLRIFFDYFTIKTNFYEKKLAKCRNLPKSYQSPQLTSREEGSLRGLFMDWWLKIRFCV